ncbi:MAG TPA: hypothetical protein VKA84_04875, partial [Gemmatimonadaceae bacterium]|nr:hypothetical protein [Gemmatimonadaceae bacterium]
GATAFYAFTGRFPFEGASATEVLAKQVTEPPPPLASLGMPVPRKLAAIVDRCLAKPPEHRPQSAQAIVEQLGVALEQRRELPVALRAFVRRYGRLDGGGTLLAGLGLLSGSVIASAAFGGYAGLTTLVLGTTAASFAYFVGAARRLTMLGFGHPDLGPAFRQEMEQAREELSIEHLSGPSSLERWLAPLAKVSASVFTVGLVLGPGAFATPWAAGAIAMIALSGLSTLVSSISLLALRQQHRDVDTEFWGRVWMGSFGKGAFALARKLLGDRTPAAAMTHRATELSLGMAAEQLYESLPKESRQALGDLPALLRRLQDDAQLLRRRYDELQELLAESGDAASSPQYADLRAARDEIHARLGEAVGALETIRLNLLRLHAGSATVAGLTTHLGLAAEVTAEVERLIAAHAEMEDVTKFPRQAAATPV